MNKKKQNKFIYQNINPNENADFEICYKEAIRLVAHLKNRLQQMAASYKSLKDKN